MQHSSAIKKQSELNPEFDLAHFPIVYVTFKKGINDDSFQYLLEQWIKCYKKKKDFTIVFNLHPVVWANPKYCYKLAKFMKKIKEKEEFSYLKRSIIILQNSIIKKLVSLVFHLQPQQSHVYIAPDMIHATGIIRGNTQFINNCVDIPPETQVKVQQNELLDQQNIDNYEKKYGYLSKS